jgi:hypothetical protein
MGHDTEQMIERRYGRYPKFKAIRPVLEYWWVEWRSRYIDQFAGGLATILTEGQRRALEVLADVTEGLTVLVWQNRLGSNPGTFFPQRNRLVQLELVRSLGRERGARYFVIKDGLAVLDISRKSTCPSAE